jgi:NADH dehydrogenase
MSTPRTIAVAGSTGFVGRAVVRELLSRGFSVRALARSRDKARAVLPVVGNPKLSIVVGDVLESGRAEELLAGADSCINCIGILREDRMEGKTFEGQHVRATRNLVQACEARSVSRFIQISALGVSEDGVCDYQKSKWESENTVRLSSLAWTILRPGLIHGPESEIVQLVKGWASGKSQPWIFMPYFLRMEEDKRVPLGPINMVDPVIQPVAVEDVAIAAAVALEKPEAIGEVYNVVGSEELSWPEMLTFMRDHLPGADRSKPAFGVPGKIMALKAKAAQFIGAGKLLPFDDGMPLMGSQDCRASLDKLHKHLGVRPHAFKASFEKYAATV